LSALIPSQISKNFDFSDSQMDNSLLLMKTDSIVYVFICAAVLFNYEIGVLTNIFKELSDTPCNIAIQLEIQNLLLLRLYSKLFQILLANNIF
jgi:hypothetical protein